MISLKVKMDDDTPEVAESPQDDKATYPYGTRIQLEGNLLEKLGIDPMDLEIGAKTTLEIEIEISSISMRSGQETYERDSVELQVTHIDPAPLITATNNDGDGGALG